MTTVTAKHRRRSRRAAGNGRNNAISSVRRVAIVQHLPLGRPVVIVAGELRTATQLQGLIHRDLEVHL